MKLYAAGEKSKAICEDCGALVSTTFVYRDVPFDDGHGVVKDVLASVCDQCDRVVALPAQSTPAVRRAPHRAPEYRQQAGGHAPPLERRAPAGGPRCPHEDRGPALPVGSVPGQAVCQ